jgi:hypothetical protein
MWGRKIPDVLASLSTCSEGGEKFYLIILSDLTFNHSQHVALRRVVGDIGHLTFRHPSTTFVGFLSLIVSLPFLSLEILTTHHDAYDLS